MLYRRSRQRERILELLRSTGSHPTADQLFAQLKDEFPALSIATVYRNLRILVEQNLIRKLEYGSSNARYEANNDPHYHLVCNRCGSISDLCVPPDRQVERRIERKTSFRITGHSIDFFGICELCQLKSSPDSKGEG